MGGAPADGQRAPGRRRVGRGAARLDVGAAERRGRAARRRARPASRVAEAARARRLAGRPAGGPRGRRPGAGSTRRPASEELKRIAALPWQGAPGAIQAAGELARLGDPSAAPTVYGALDSDNRVLRTIAAKQLLFLADAGEPDARERIDALPSDEDDGLAGDRPLAACRFVRAFSSGPPTVECVALGLAPAPAARKRRSRSAAAPSALAAARRLRPHRRGRPGRRRRARVVGRHAHEGPVGARARRHPALRRDARARHRGRLRGPRDRAHQRRRAS